MTRFWDGRTDGQTDGQTDGRSDCTPRPAFAFGDAGKKMLQNKTNLKTNIQINYENNNFEKSNHKKMAQLLNE